MGLIALCSLLVGSTLGTRLRVFVLLPVSLLGGVLIGSETVLNGVSALSAAADIAVWTICLQVGYLGGLLTRYCMSAARVAPDRPLPTTVIRG